MSESKGFRIARFVVEDVKGVHRVEANDLPDSTTIIIYGDNEQGKSSTLDGLEMCLRGKRKFGLMPIRRGARRATITVDIADEQPFLTIKRVITPGSTSLHITKADGTKWTENKQATLDELLGAFAMDPMEFLTLKPREQVRALIEAYHPKFDLDDIDAKRKDLVLQRRDANRDVDRLTTLVGDVPARVEGEVVEKVDVEALHKQLNEAHSVARQRSSLRESVGKIDDTIAEQEEIIRKANSALENARIVRAKTSERLRDLEFNGPPADAPTTLNQQISNATTINERAAALEKRDKDAEALAQYNALAEGYDDHIGDLDQKVTDAIKAIKLPSGNMTVSPDGIAVGTFPLSQLNTAAQTLACIEIACNWPADCKFVRLRDGNGMDESTMAKAAEIAKAAGCQLFIERVVSDVGIEIRGGRVVDKLVEDMTADNPELTSETV